MDPYPVAFVEPETNTELYVVDKNVPVFSVEQARIVFQSDVPGLRVWGMKPPVTNLLLSVQQAREFFSEIPK